MEKYENKKVEIIIPEYQEKIELYKKESSRLQEEIDSYLKELKDALDERAECEILFSENPNDKNIKKRLNEIQADIDMIHDNMNDLSLKKIKANFDIQTYEKVNQNHSKTITKIPKESLN